jgi:hypothetical protein
LPCSCFLYGISKFPLIWDEKLKVMPGNQTITRGQCDGDDDKDCWDNGEWNGKCDDDKDSNNEGQKLPLCDRS